VATHPKKNTIVMARKEFSKAVVKNVLIRCLRHCCVCGRWCGQKIEIHHIDSPDDNSEENAISVCFDCHAEIGHYDPKHPKGKKYTADELRELRDRTYSKYSQDLPEPPKGTSDYGRGFHDGVVWAERINVLKDIWRLLSIHGDFILEILIHFEKDDYDTIMDETLMDHNVETEMGVSQHQAYSHAWSAGQAARLWDLDGNAEQLFLTNRGKIFREVVFNNQELKDRFEQLKEFWSASPFHGKVKKPPRLQNRDHGPRDFEPGVLNWLQVEIHSLIRRKDDRSQVFIIQNVTPAQLTLQNLETGEMVVFEKGQIKEVEVDRESGELLLDV